jgi:DNA-binding XRE family transcriptional regulator
MSKKKSDRLSDQRIEEIRKEMTEFNFDETFEDYSLRAARVNAGYSREDVSQILAVVPSTITLWEKSGRVPKFSVFIALCKLYRVRPEKIRNSGFEETIEFCKKMSIRFDEFATVASKMGLVSKKG